MNDRLRLFLRKPDTIKIGKVVPIPEDLTDYRYWLLVQIRLFVDEVGCPVRATVVPHHSDNPQVGANGKKWVTFGA